MRLHGGPHIRLPVILSSRAALMIRASFLHLNPLPSFALSPKPFDLVVQVPEIPTLLLPLLLLLLLALPQLLLPLLILLELLLIPIRIRILPLFGFPLQLLLLLRILLLLLFFLLSHLPLLILLALLSIPIRILLLFAFPLQPLLLLPPLYFLLFPLFLLLHHHHLYHLVMFYHLLLLLVSLLQFFPLICLRLPMLCRRIPHPLLWLLCHLWSLIPSLQHVLLLLCILISPLLALLLSAQQQPLSFHKEVEADIGGKILLLPLHRLQKIVLFAF